MKVWTPTNPHHPLVLTLSPITQAVCLSFQPPLTFFPMEVMLGSWLSDRHFYPMLYSKRLSHISTLVPLILNCLYPFRTWKDFSRGCLAKALVLPVIGFHYSYLWQYILPIFFLNYLSFSHWFIEVTLDTWVILVKILNIQSDCLYCQRLHRDEVKLLRGCFIVCQWPHIICWVSKPGSRELWTLRALVFIRKLIIFLYFNTPPWGCLILFILFQPIYGYELCSFTEISKETQFLSLMNMYGKHTVGLRHCEYTLPKHEYKKLTAL